MLRVVGLDEELDRPGSERGIDPLDRRRDESPAESLGEHVGRDLTPVQVVGEVPEGPLAVARLVDREQLAASVGLDPHQEGEVGAPRQAPLDRELADGERVAHHVERDAGVGAPAAQTAGGR